jgi:dethiobiotin synthetase
VRGFFVTGTDTGVGKTCISAGLLTVLAGQGFRCAGFKPVAAGLEEGGLPAVNDDVQALQAASNVSLDPHKVGPFQFRAACAPHLAAQQEGVRLPRGGWRERALAVSEEAEVLIAEGAGGFCVPLSQAHEAPRWGLDDVAVELGWPVVLVVGLRLGCLNHALLTAQAIAARGLLLAGWVCNRVDPLMLHADDNLASLRAWLPAPCWGDVPWMDAPSPLAVAAALDAPSILKALAVQPC